MNGNVQTLFWENVKKRRLPTHSAVEAYVRPKLDFIWQYVDGIGSALDVGCGSGSFTWYMSTRVKTTGLDISERMLSLNPCGKSGVQLVRGTVLEMPFPDNSFDLVFCANLLHHLSDPQKAMREMCRVSRIFVVSIEPNRDNLLMAAFLALRSEERNGLRYSRRYIRQLYESVGLSVLAIRNMGVIAPNMTPVVLVPWLKPVDRFGNISHVIIGYKGG